MSENSAGQAVVAPPAAVPPDIAGRYMPELNTLRALAFLSVAGIHWLRGSSPIQVFLTIFRQTLGVWLFFVLSGFLITGILLRCRESVRQEHVTRLREVRQFYIRRFLRIFPLYYMVVFVAAYLNVPAARAGFWWLVTYNANFWWALNKPPPGFNPAGVFWTLATEEQFYLLWPWLVMFLPDVALLPAVLICIAVSPCADWIAIRHGFTNMWMLLPGGLQFLGAGALMALCGMPKYTGRLTRKILWRVFFWISVPVLLCYGQFILSHQLQIPADEQWVESFKEYFLPLFLAMFFAAVIGRIAHGVSGPTGQLLRFPPAVYLGTISYGLYVYHQFMLLLLLYLLQTHWILSRLTSMQFETIYENFWVRFVLTAAVASISWHFFEAPLNNLKRYFPYAARQRAGVAPRPT